MGHSPTPPSSSSDNTAQFRAIFDHSLDGILLTHPNGTILDANPAAQRILGRSKEDICALGRSALVDVGDPRVKAALEERDRTGTFSGELTLLRRDGTPFPVELTTSLFQSNGVTCANIIFRDVSARRDAQAALHRAEARFQLAFQHSKDAIVITHAPSGRYVDVNPGAGNLLGYSKEELIGRTSDELHIWADPANRDAMLALMASHGEVTNFEAHFRTKDGTVRSALFSAVVVTMEGEPHILSASRDITDHKRAEAERKAIDERYRVILQTALDGFWRVDANGRLLEVNDAACRKSGYTAGEMLGLHMQELDSADENGGSLSQRVLEVAAGAGDRFESRQRRKDGSVFDVEVGVMAQRAPDAGFVVFLRDITPRKLALREEARAHDLLINLARLVPGVIYQYQLWPDGHSAFPYASPGMNDIYEVTPEDVRQDATAVFGRLHPEDYDHVANAIQESARTLSVFYCEFRVLLPRQGLRWRWSQAHPERMQDGSTLWHGIISDITERKQAELEKATLAAELQQAQKMESVGRLAGGVAHDFNNMLGVILGHAEMAMESVDPQNAARTDLEEILKAARRSAELTRQLLAFARRQTIAPRVLDLGVTISGMVSMLRRLIGEDIRLHWVAGERLWNVKVDPSQVDQLLANLCVNARDAIRGGGNVHIEVVNVHAGEEECARCPGLLPGDHVRLSVRDDGCGMSPETRAHLFEPFFTTKGLGKGTGLGLATVYGIVQQNGAFIHVDTAPGHGTTMSIYFSRHRDGDAVDSQPPLQGLAPVGHEVVLVVEDEPAMLRITTALLQGLGYVVLPAHSAAEAQHLAALHAPDVKLLLTDVVMPDMNGRDLANRLRARDPGLKCLFMSGYTADVIARQGVLDEGVNFLQKPFTREALALQVRRALERG